MTKRWGLAAAALIVIVAAILAFVQIEDLWPAGPMGPVVPSNDAAGGWANFGNDPGGQRFSPLDQVNRDNVRHLQVAWTYRTGDWARAQRDKATIAYTFQVTPILVDGRLIGCTQRHRVFALDPGTGKLLWSFDPQVHPTAYGDTILKCRAVSAWTDPQAAPDQPCATEILLAASLQIFALDERTGKLCRAFGKGGVVTVRPEGMEFADEVELRGPPAIAGGVAVFGSTMADIYRTNSPSGKVRAFDLRTGALRWEFDPVPRDAKDPAAKTWGKGSNLTVGSGNAWSILSADPKLDMIYVPTTSPSADFYGANRPGENRYANSLVALDATTGKIVWHFQVTHHDLWDSDLPAQPILTDIVRGGRHIPAVIQVTKQGMVFVFDRRNGTPLFPIAERPVPQHTDIPGEWLSPTQPFPTQIAPVVQQGLKPEQAWGFTPIDRAACRDQIKALNSFGMYTPPSQKGSVEMPAAQGGMNWSGGAIDVRHNLLIAPALQVASVVKLIPREQAPPAAGYGEAKDATGTFVFPLTGTPYLGQLKLLTSPLGAPCTAPPWSKLVAIDLTTGRKKWDVPLGTIENFAPIPIPLKMGAPFTGGPIATAGGLIFMAGTGDSKIRAFDVETGKVLWRRRLPAAGMATPMTYSWHGRQYVVIAAGGGNIFPGPKGDSLVAYTLDGK